MSIEAWDAYSRRRAARRVLMPDASTPLHGGAVEEAYRNLAVAVIRQALTDATGYNRQHAAGARLHIRQGNLDGWLDATALDEETKAALRLKLRGL